MNIKVSDTIPLLLNDFVKPSASQITSPAENPPTTPPEQAQTFSIDQFSLKNLQIQQARQFLYEHVTGKLISPSSNTTRLTQSYAPIIEDEQSLQKLLENSVGQSVGQSSNNINYTQINQNIDEGFKEASDVLKMSNSLPETLQNEFTRLRYSLSDFITRLNQLTANGINPDFIQLDNSISTSIQNETINRDFNTSPAGQTLSSQQKNLELYQQLEKTSERSTQHLTGNLLDTILTDYTA